MRQCCSPDGWRVYRCAGHTRAEHSLQGTRLVIKRLEQKIVLTDEEELHVVEGKGGKLDVRVVLPPVGVGLQRHAQSTVVSQVLPQGEVAVHLCVGYRVLVILIPQTAGLAVECLDSFVVVELG